MPYVFRPLDGPGACAVLSWRYAQPYDVYNPDPMRQEQNLRALLDPANAYQAIYDLDELVAFCCFGEDARVPGGDYSLEALDIGLGLRPDLTGHGRGLALVMAILDWATERFSPATLRLTVASFNMRARRVYDRAGFHPVQTFRHPQGGREFVVLVRPAGIKEC